jgi:hypothetical protein
MRPIALATLAALVLTGLTLLATGPAPGQESDVVTIEGRAEGLFFDVDVVATPSEDAGPLLGPTGEGAEPLGAVPVNFGPTPVVEVGPQSGASTQSLADITIPTGPFPPFTTALAEVSTEGATGAEGFARSSFRLTNFDFGGISGDQANSECEATAAGATGSANFVNATVPSDPAPNTVITSAEQPVLRDNITIILNEQEIVSSPLGQRIEVTALHVLAAPSPDAQFIGEFYVGRTVCGVTLPEPPVVAPEPPVVAEPTFTG